MNSWAITDKGMKRKQNQDMFYSFCDAEKGIALILVCDGMGGAKAGNIASKMAAEMFVSEVKPRLEEKLTKKELMKVLDSAVMKANTVIYAKSLSDDDFDGMGTTLVAAIITPECTLVLNVGDSRAYHITKRSIRQITKDHSVVEEMVERGDISREESKNHPQKNLITRAIGTAFTIDCDIFEEEIKQGEYILLCSDGLSNLVTEREMKAETLNGESNEDSCESLIKLALKRGAPDNVTVVLFTK